MVDRHSTTHAEPDEGAARFTHLPPRVLPSTREQPHTGVPGSIDQAPDTVREFLVRHAG